jgi:hypothetical protein
METKTVTGRGDTFFQRTVANHTAAGWTVEHINKSTLGRFTVVFTKTEAETPPRPDSAPVLADVVAGS